MQLIVVCPYCRFERTMGRKLQNENVGRWLSRHSPSWHGVKVHIGRVHRGHPSEPRVSLVVEADSPDLSDKRAKPLEPASKT